MSDDYISREAAIEKLCDRCGECLKAKGKDCAVVRIMDKVPAADVTEVRHGHWIEWDDGEGDTFECSVCGEPWTLNAGTPEENNMHYCPKCGALMYESEDGKNV